MYKPQTFITHTHSRDLKLENIMFESGAKDARIRLIDFGLSKTFDRAVEGLSLIHI